MKHNITRRIVPALIAGTLLTFLAPIHAADMAAPPAGVEEKAKPPGPIPFNGKILSVDRTAKTITLDGKERKRVIHISPQTKFAKAGKPAKLDDAVAGDEIGGQVVKTVDGKEEAVSLRFGPKPEVEPKPVTPKKAAEKMKN